VFNLGLVYIALNVNQRFVTPVLFRLVLSTVGDTGVSHLEMEYSRSERNGSAGFTTARNLKLEAQAHDGHQAEADSGSERGSS